MVKRESGQFGWTILLLLAALLGSAWINASREPAAVVTDTTGLPEAPLPGYRAPDFTLTAINGETITLSALRGRPVVLNFWATWCPPCRVEMPFFQRASANYNGRAIVLGISDGETADVVTRFAAQNGLSYPLLPDSDSQVSRQYATRALPTTFFIDADGMITEVHSGIINQAVLEDKIERLLNDAADH